ncbi:MAG TPA: hypothetical protein DCY85_01830, partial [Firmicutes bacterium]|nr:hypothetical protein [Bacillota bacterium]
GGEGGSGIGSGGGFDLIKILGSIGIPIFVAALIMLLCTWTFNDRSLYSYGIVINFVTGRERYRSLFIILGGVVAIFCAWLGVNDRVLTVLNWIGRIFVPLLAVFAYYFYFKYPRQTRVAGGGGGGNCDCDCDCKAAHDYEHQFNYQPFVAWLLGVLISCLAENRLLLSFGISLVVYALLDSFAPAGKLGGKVAGQTETKG